MVKLPVDVEMLAHALESHGETQWYLDRETGDVLPVFDDPELEEQVEETPERYFFIEAAAPPDGFRDMEAFVAALPEGEAKRDLERVLRRAKPFRNFREALRDWPDLREKWFEQHNRRAHEVAMEWLADHEIEATPRPSDGSSRAN